MKRIPKYPICILLILIPVWLLAQKMVVTTLAEPFTISVAPLQNNLLPEKGTTYGPFEILDIQMQKTIDSVGMVQLQLVAYDTGLFRLANVMPEVVTDTAYLIKIIPPSESDIKEYGQPKEITIATENAEESFPWWFIAGVLAIAGFLIFYFFKQKKKLKNPDHMQVAEHAEDILLALESQWKKEEITSTQLGEKLVYALHVHFRVPSKKTISSLYKAITEQVQDVNKEEIKNCLRLSDAWRFGKQHADKRTGEQTIETVKKIVMHPASSPQNQTHV